MVIPRLQHKISLASQNREAAQRRQALIFAAAQVNDKRNAGSVHSGRAQQTDTACFDQAAQRGGAPRNKAAGIDVDLGPVIGHQHRAERDQPQRQRGFPRA